MKALIISYYWPPAGGSGVQRWLKFVKYLPEFGITPVVYVPKNAHYPTIDEKLVADVPINLEVLQQPIFNPQDVLLKPRKKGGVANISKGGFLSWVRGNLFIPDAKVLWVRKSVNFLYNYTKKHKIDVIISSGPPHSMHLIAKKIKQKTGIKWIADFRDPWTNLYYSNDFKLTTYAKRKNERLEKQVLQQADLIVTVSKTLQQEFSKTATHVSVITNGYDDEVMMDDLKLTKEFTISYIGLLPKQSNPILLWEVLKELSDDIHSFKNDLRICLTGNICEEAITSITQNGLAKNFHYNGYVPHNKAIQLQKQSQVLLLLIPKSKNSKGILTGKLFEYITAKRPILAIGDKEGDLAPILHQTNTGSVVDFEDKQMLKSTIIQLYNAYKNNDLFVEPQDINKYHRRYLTQQLATHIKNLIQL